jgi:hypothetical protein
MIMHSGSNPQPYSSNGVNVANQALQRWLDQQRTATGQFTAAAQPLQQSIEMFQPGGSYGTGQKTLLEEQAKQAQAQALANSVASGMSNSSLATGIGLNVQRGLAQGLAGVEDTRTQFLNQALQALAGLRGQQAGTTATNNEPVTQSFLPYLSNVIGINTQANQAAAQRSLDLELAKLKTSQPQSYAPTGSYTVPQF